MPGPKPTDRAGRRVARALRKPPTIRAAGALIVSFTALTVFVSGLLMRLLDPKEYPTLGRALWWAVQTVTSVGYGDVAPGRVAGRIVGTVVMLEGIAFISVLTAVITSMFVERARREQREAAGEATVERSLAEVAERLARIEQALSAPDRQAAGPAARPGAEGASRPPRAGGPTRAGDGREG